MSELNREYAAKTSVADIAGDVSPLHEVLKSVRAEGQALQNYSFSGSNMSALLSGGEGFDAFAEQRAERLFFNGTDLTGVDFTDFEGKDIFMIGHWVQNPEGMDYGWDNLEDQRVTKGGSIVLSLEDLRSYIEQKRAKGPSGSLSENDRGLLHALHQDISITLEHMSSVGNPLAENNSSQRFRQLKQTKELLEKILGVGPQGQFRVA